MTRPALILLSGGLDSATCLAIADDAGFNPLHTLAFDYGQRHCHELTAAAKLAQLHNAHHRLVHIDLRAFGGSALTADIDVPKDRSPHDMAHGIPITYVPARNTVFLSFALALAEVTRSRDIFIGVNALDYSGYPDCRPEFIAAFQSLANLATQMATEDPEHPVLIHAPLLHLTKAEIIRRGTALGVDYALTHSCYDPTPVGLACGHCDSCALRRKGFADAHIPDPTVYA